MANIISIFNSSKNSGKTTTAYYLARSLAAFENKILLIDSCQNKGLNKYFSVIDHKDLFLFSDFFHENQSYDFFEYVSENLKFSFIPYKTVDEKVENYKVFTQNIEKITNNYDYIIFDTSSRGDALNDMVLSVSDSVLIPLESEFYGIEGLEETLMYIYEKQIDFPNLIIEGLLLNRFIDSNHLAHKIESKLKETFETLILNTIVPRSFLLSYQLIPQSINDLKLNDLGCQAYMELAREIINKKTVIV